LAVFAEQPLGLFEIFSDLVNGGEVKERPSLLRGEERKHAQDRRAGAGADIEDPEAVLLQNACGVERKLAERKMDLQEIRGKEIPEIGVQQCPVAEIGRGQ
jgi:hypothetical protein